MKTPHLIDLEEASLPTESTFQDPPRPLGVRLLREVVEGGRELLIVLGAALVLPAVAALWFYALPAKDQAALKRGSDRVELRLER